MVFFFVMFACLFVFVTFCTLSYLNHNSFAYIQSLITVCNRARGVHIREVSVPRGSTVTSTSLFISLPSKWVRGAALLAGYSRVGAHCAKYTCQMQDSGNHSSRNIKLRESKDLAKDFRGTTRS